MPSPGPLRCDIFCHVVDNYGDIGVCWRLARQMAGEHGLAVRLWVDDLAVFARICPSLEPCAAPQIIDGVDVRRWDEDFPQTLPGDIVVETFACQLPEVFVAMMACRHPAPVWINLDYLSAEPWIAGCHALPSPHPRLPLVKYFFFPGFDETTGGLLRESGLNDERQRFLAAADAQTAFWQRLGSEAPAQDALRLSLFAYENAALPTLLAALAAGEKPVCCLAPLTRTQKDIEAFLGQPVQAGGIYRRDRLEIRVLPFVTPEDYDRLLWLCDANFVRGEDSFVRAQWAARPMLWHIYPQDKNAHRVKLEAFLDRYAAGLPEAPAALLRGIFLAWNGFGEFSGELVAHWNANRAQFRQHAENWQKKLIKQEDLCACLVRFCQSKL